MISSDKLAPAHAMVLCSFVAAPCVTSCFVHTGWERDGIIALSKSLHDAQVAEHTPGAWVQRFLQTPGPIMHDARVPRASPISTLNPQVLLPEVLLGSGFLAL
jgi:hypothetical protein